MSGVAISMVLSSLRILNVFDFSLISRSDIDRLPEVVFILSCMRSFLGVTINGSFVGVVFELLALLLLEPPPHPHPPHTIVVIGLSAVTVAGVLGCEYAINCPESEVMPVRVQYHPDIVQVSPYV